MNIAKIRRDNERYRKANPWVLCNLENSIALCGRYPTQEAAVAAADQRGGCKGIHGFQVYFAQMPSL